MLWKIKILYGINVIYRFFKIVSKSYRLDLKNRVAMQSPKNFQLMKDDEMILQFGKLNEHTYSMDFQYPLSPFQAFAVCLTSLASKRAVE